MTAGDIELHADGASGGAAHQEDILPFAEYISWENVIYFPLCENGSLSSGTQENTDIQRLRNMTFLAPSWINAKTSGHFYTRK